ncbi:response regulator transcription factor [Alishewanella sp. 16-MA]|uniref:Response regulator transcription factor n=1 Tax=Alishewanella maricola TaxID=2795740 RepID=A0ABS8C0M0_9ALTE|nr:MULTISPECIES: response regulator transcription factor [Alishewanella]MDP4944824.1 response regulator transcription factor [Alishewanella sp.]MCB5225859.1 response regulator transcription factor [Alishewanella maricola]MDP5035036.1 response regulator transcription factor [Alishewanella sp.]MDP5187964.1 response regulator transcription factor [Alishewanella sp.]MDP5458220.1 response regulator transcription factor [Alishewanella sp. SMS8]
MNILLAEDQAMVRTALATLLQLEADYSVTEAADGNTALALLKKQRFDLLLSDIEMPGHTGIELAQYVQQQKLATKVVIITTFGRAGYVKRAIDAGVGGFLLKDAPVAELVSAISQVMAGKRVIDSELLLNSLGDQDPLSEKERQALRLATEGLSTSEIAAALYIAEGTARNYLSEAISKLNASNRIDAARIARHKGWL